MTMPADQAEETFTRWACGHEDAVRFLFQIGRVARLADDITDGDSRNVAADMGRLLFEALVTLPTNPFFLRHHATLAPILANVALTWEATEDWRRSNNEKTRMFAFVLRECSEQIATTVAMITGGYDHARTVIREAHLICTIGDNETFSDWENEQCA